jgi:hypothetical protein
VVVLIENMNTQNLSNFGYRELEIASKLLRALTENEWNSKDDVMGNEVRLEFNPQSGYVFLTDEDYNVAMLNDKSKLENWLSCGECGKEGPRSEVAFSDYNNLCEECAKKNEKK